MPTWTATPGDSATTSFDASRSATCLGGVALAAGLVAAYRGKGGAAAAALAALATPLSFSFRCDSISVVANTTEEGGGGSTSWPSALLDPAGAAVAQATSRAAIRWRGTPLASAYTNQSLVAVILPQAPAAATAAVSTTVDITTPPPPAAVCTCMFMSQILAGTWVLFHCPSALCPWATQRRP